MKNHSFFNVSFLSLVFILLFSGCASTLRTKSLQPIEMKGLSGSVIPYLTPIIDKHHSDIAFADELLYIARNSYKGFDKNAFASDMHIVLDRDLKINLSEGEDESYGYIICKVINQDMSYSIAPACLAGLTVVGPLLGMPLSSLKINSEIIFEVINCKDEKIKTYNISVNDKWRSAIYYNNYSQYDAIFRDAAIKAFKKSLEQFNRNVIIDASEISSNLNTAMNEVKEDRIKAQKSVFINDDLANAIKKYTLTKAIDPFSEIILKNPYNAYAYLARCVAYLDSELYAEALSDINRTIQLNPSIDDAYYNKALILHSIRRNSEAMYFIKKVGNLDADIKNIVLYGAILEQEGYLTQAKQKYEKALSINPNLVHLHSAIDNIDRIFSNNAITESVARQRQQELSMMALQMASQSLQNAFNSLSSSNCTTGTTYAPTKSNIGKRQVCSFCKGTGKNPTRERAAFYNYASDDKSNPPCKICGDRSDHYHKDCPSCLGKGYK